MKAIILGTAHLKSTPGKCSPDGRLKEYAYSREVVNYVKSVLENFGYKVFIDIPEDDLRITTNQELVKRVRFVNDLCKKYDCIYVSIHVNAAAADGKWHNATGWECYTTKGLTKADTLAEYLYKSAEENLKGKKIRKDLSDKDSDKEADFYVLKHTNCPAVLTENFFQDTKSDVDYLLSNTGFHEVCLTHIEGITKYLLR